MKNKMMLGVYIVTALLLAQIILIVGCGKNPVSSVINSAGSGGEYDIEIGVGKL